MPKKPKNQPQEAQGPKPEPPDQPAATTPPKERNCGTMPVHHRLLRTDPTYARARIASENHHAATAQGQRALARTGITTIPVVVHVIHNTAAQNISEAQIKSQIDVLNRDFRRTNADAASVPAPFAPLAADAPSSSRWLPKTRTEPPPTASHEHRPTEPASPMTIR